MLKRLIKSILKTGLARRLLRLTLKALPDSTILKRALRVSSPSKRKPNSSRGWTADPVAAAYNVIAKDYLKSGDIVAAQASVATALARYTSDPRIHVTAGQIAGMEGVPERALYHWSKAASLFGQHDPKVMRRVHINLMKNQALMAIENFDKGHIDDAMTRIGKAVSYIDTSTYVKARPYMVDAITRYLLHRTRDMNCHSPARNPKHIIICLDVIKMSAVHSHKHLYLSIAASLIDLDPEIRVTIVATHERQLSENVSYFGYYSPDNAAELSAFADAKLPVELRDRLSIIYYDAWGLEGLAQTCASILEMKPDIILYGGGAKGFHSNESLLVRRALFGRVPTAFFFVQSNNPIDEFNDVIVARGDYEVVGDPGDALVRLQAYPSFTGLGAAQAPEGIVNQPYGASRKAIVTAWVGIRLDNALNALTDHQVDAFIAILDQNPDVDWHFIGADEPKSIQPRHSAFQKYCSLGRVRIHSVMEYEQFYGHVAHADALFQFPGFTGGGAGASVARNADVPIICFRNSDVAPLQPRQYVFAEDRLQDGLDALRQILTDARAKDDLVTEQRRLMETRRATSAQAFYDCLVEGIEHFHARSAAFQAGTLPLLEDR